MRDCGPCHDRQWALDRFRAAASGRLSGSVDLLGRKARKFRHPTAHVVAAWIRLRALGLGIEDAKVRLSVRAAASNPLPAERIVREIRVHQRVPEPRAPCSQGSNRSFTRKKRPRSCARDCASSQSATTPASRIHQRETGPPLLPSLQKFRVASPRELRELQPQRLIPVGAENGTADDVRTLARPVGANTSRPPVKDAPRSTRHTCRGPISPKWLNAASRDVPSIARACQPPRWLSKNRQSGKGHRA